MDWPNALEEQEARGGMSALHKREHKLSFCGVSFMI